VQTSQEPEHFQFELQTDDGLTLFAQGWQPASSARAIACLVHGIGEHSGRYAHVGQALCQAGYGLATFDLRGHGHSEGKRGYTPSYATLLQDIQHFEKEIARRYPALPRLLYGHSLGATLVLSLILDYRTESVGAVITGPLFRTAFEPPSWKLALGNILYSLWPGFVKSNELNPHHVSSSPEVVDAYINDPLVHDRLSASLGIGMLREGASLLHRAGEIRLPLLLMIGSDDHLVSAEACSEFMAGAGDNCTLKVWEGLYHEVHNEPIKKEVLAYMVAWMDRLV